MNQKNFEKTLAESFRSEDDERKFWETHDTSEYFDFDNGFEAEFSNYITHS